MAGINTGLLSNAYPLSHDEIKELEKRVLEKQKTYAYINEHGESCVIMPYGVSSIKDLAWKNAYELSTENNLLVKRAYKKASTDTFYLNDTFTKEFLSDSWQSASAIEELEGSGSEYYTTAPSVLSFRSTAPLADFQEVRVNGVVVDPSNYTLEEGSTIVKFSIDYLKTLDLGNHEVSVVSNTKTAKGDFIVKAPVINEHRFYYNQPYSAYVEYFGGDTVFFLREGGVMDALIIDQLYVEKCTYALKNNALVITAAAGTFTGEVVENGIFCPELNVLFKLDDSKAVADEDYIYVINDDASFVLSVIDNTKSTYRPIRSNINGKPVEAIYENAFLDCINLRSISIPSCIKLVLGGAFAGCINLDEVIFENCTVGYWGDPFPDSPLAKGVTKKHSYFKNAYVCDTCRHCEHTRTKVVGKTFEYSGDTVCGDCGKIIKKGAYVIPEGATYYVASTNETLTENDVFPAQTKDGDIFTYGHYKYTYNVSSSPYNHHHAGWSVSSTESVDLVNILTRINGNDVTTVHSLGRNLQSIVIPKYITCIGSYAFANCSSLTEVIFEENSTLTAIGNSAFSKCSALTSITIPDSVTTLGDYSFQHCYLLKNITFSKNSKLKSIGKGAFSGNQNYSGAGFSNIDIPEGVIQICDEAFSYCNNLESITLPSTLIKVGSSGSDSTFGSCKKLKSVYYKGTLEQWCNIQFYYHAGPCLNGADLFIKEQLITTLTVPDGVTAINSYAFEGCTSILNVVIPDTVASIGKEAFWRCSSMDSIIIGKSITSIDYCAFAGCTALTNIAFVGTVEEWNEIKKGNLWKSQVPATYVQCTDGQVTL